MSDTKDLSRPAQLLIDWFAVHARKLPWRENYNLYHALVSEFMLQQTRVETVIPYYNRWMERWPDLASLASANEDEALKLWEGLGYYSRCRNLLKSARILHNHLTHEANALSLDVFKSCPGVGEYTAGAVASVGLGLSLPAVDGNAERVIGRFAALDLTVGSVALRREVSGIVTEMLSHVDARNFNQAVMDLGAMICTPRSPNCALCPWCNDCRAHVTTPTHETDFPKARMRPTISNDKAWGLILFRDTCDNFDKNSSNAVDDGCACHSSARKILLHRRPPHGLWAGMWEIPWCERTDAGFKSDFAAWCSNIGVAVANTIATVEPIELGTVTFSFTTHRVRTWVIALDVSSLVGLADLTIKDQESEQIGEWRFTSCDTLETITLPASSRKFLSTLKKTQIFTR